MHYFVKILFVVLLVLVTGGCDDGEKIQYEISVIEQNTDDYSINGEKIMITGESGGVESFNAKISDEIARWREDFITRVSDLKNKGSVLPQLQFKNIVKFNEDGIFSVITEKYAYISGLHGNTWRTSVTYDSEGDKLLVLSDLFVDKNFYGILNERIEELIKENEEVYHDLWENPVVDEKREDKFYLEGDRLVIYYEPYELSYYARGVVEFPIEMESIRGYVREKYLPEKAEYN